MNQPLSEYLKNKEIRNNMRYTCNPQRQGYVILEHCIISDEEVNEMLPLREKVLLWNHNNKGQNPDKTKNWMNGEKSY